MKDVILSPGSLFHAAPLARALHENDSLRYLVSSYPKYKLREEGLRSIVNEGLAKTKPTAEIAGKLLSWLYYIGDIKKYDLYAKARIMDEYLSTKIDEKTNVVHVWAQFAEKSLSICRDLNVYTVLERGASHIDFHIDTIEKEASKRNIRVSKWMDKIKNREKREYKMADEILVPSTFAKKTFEGKQVEMSKISVVPYGVDTNMFKPTKVNSRGNKFRVLYVGGMRIEKGIHYLIEALSKLPKNDVELWLVGPEGNAGVKERVKRFENITFLGSQPKSRLPQIYSAADVFVLPSLTEGCALVGLEALACGLPIIATRNTGYVQKLRDTKCGTIIPPADVDALYCSIKKAMDFVKSEESIKTEARNIALENSWEQYIDGCISIYDRQTKS